MAHGTYTDSPMPLHPRRQAYEDNRAAADRNKHRQSHAGDMFARRTLSAPNSPRDRQSKSPSRAPSQAPSRHASRPGSPRAGQAHAVDDRCVHLWIHEAHVGNVEKNGGSLCHLAAMVVMRGGLHGAWSSVPFTSSEEQTALVAEHCQEALVPSSLHTFLTAPSPSWAKTA